MCGAFPPPVVTLCVGHDVALPAVLAWRDVPNTPLSLSCHSLTHPLRHGGGSASLALPPRQAAVPFKEELCQDVVDLKQN